MKVGIYTPYLETIGGGERYMLSIAKYFLENGDDVFIQNDNLELIQKIESRFKLGITGIKSVENVNRGEGYDFCFWLSDGSIPALLAKKNIIHFQRPFLNVDGKSLLNRMKFFRISDIVVNSKFTKKYIDIEFPKKSIVLYPPIDTESFRPAKKKENIILYVGRFSELEQNKRQDILVDSFIKLGKEYKNNWKLVLAGGSDVGRTNFVEKIKNRAKSFSIDILENISFSEMKELYSKSKIFWSAAGYGVDEKVHPEKMEHFGMTVVEAMSAGNIPVIFNGGGHCEIIENEVNGYLWNNQDNLINTTITLIKNKIPNTLINSSKNKSKDFSYENFTKNIQKITS